MITSEELAGLMVYDPLTGLFTWIVQRGQRITPGKVAGYHASSGYVVIRTNGRNYKAHRLAILASTGEWPTDVVDHIDGNPANNKLDNLRVVTRSVNLQNQRKAHINNPSGYLGVAYSNKGVRRWGAVLKVDGKAKRFGYFFTPKEAHEAYLTAKREFHEGCTI